MTTRQIHRLIKSMPASDGAGVKLRRSLGQSNFARLDPFLMLDEFSSDDAADYIAGFPSHPHRGFETVTYILDGHMLHEDHLGGGRWVARRVALVLGLVNTPFFVRRIVRLGMRRNARRGHLRRRRRPLMRRAA